MNFKKILGFAIGPIGSAILGLGVVPLNAWLFSTEDIGRYNIFQTCISLCLILFTLGLDSAYVREYHGSRDLPALLKACFLPGFIVMIATLVVATFFPTEVTVLLYNIDDPRVFGIMIIVIVLTYISRYLSLILRMQERGIAYSLSEIIPRAMQLLILGIIFAFQIERGLLTMFCISAFSLFVIVILYAFNTKENWLSTINAEVSQQLQISVFKFGLPLVVSGFSYWALTATGSVLLRSMSTLGELGLYSVTISIAAVAAIFQSIFSVVWAPIVYKWIDDGVDASRLDRVTHQALGVICMIICMVGSFSWLIDYIFPNNYNQIKYTLVCAVVPTLLYTLSEITSIGISITRKTTLTIWITSAALAINVMISYWLIPKFGASGAVISNAISYLVFFIGRTEMSVKVWRQFPRVKLYIVIFTLVLFAISNVLFGSLLSSYTSILWMSVVPFIFLEYRKELAANFSLLIRYINILRQ